MEIHEKQIDRALVVAPVGSIDALTAGEISGLLRTRVAGGQHCLLLDLSQVDFMSSSGIRVIIDALKRTRQAGGDLILIGAQPGIHRTLELAGLLRILKSYSSVEEAVAGLVG